MDAMPSLKTDNQTLYETDYLQWLEKTVEKLQSQDYGNVDWENLASLQNRSSNFSCCPSGVTILS
jgi:hypothetical protein